MAGVLKMKALKPKALKEKDMRLEFLNGLRAAGTAIIKDYEDTVATWDHKPTFERVIALGKDKGEVLVATDDEIYNYVDKGTKPHIIVPKKAKRLAFKTGGSPKTQPGVLKAGSGSPGTSQVYSLGVRHPGTKARNFSEKINEKHKKLFKERMHEAMRRARAKSGHAI